VSRVEIVIFDVSMPGRGVRGQCCMSFDQFQNDIIKMGFIYTIDIFIQFITLHYIM